jgi:dienelactone hydrolase
MPLTSRPLTYEHDGLGLGGEFIGDDGAPTPSPGILLIHGGAGLNDHARGQAGRYAALGYRVLACDMYGEGVAGNRERVVETITLLRNNPDLLAARAAAGLAALTARSEVAGPVACVGFCFGGLSALTLARSGADLAATISMHGSLETTKQASPGAIAGKVLVCHGARDPHVHMAQVMAFCREMTDAGADWEVSIYGNAMHGFTHSEAVPGAIPGVEYHEPTDRLSFAAARTLLSEALGAAGS